MGKLKKLPEFQKNFAFWLKIPAGISKGSFPGFFPLHRLFFNNEKNHKITAWGWNEITARGRR